MNNYDYLDSSQVNRTIELLQARIRERFPGSGLSGVCQQLLLTGQRSEERIRWIARPNYAIRITTLLIIGLILFVLLEGLFQWTVPEERYKLGEFVQLLEAGLNDLILIGGTLLFFATVETRIKRSRALKEMHVLRCLAHIVDMHQLAKDPERAVTSGIIYTESSPRLNMSPEDLGRYLDYCSEMLALIGKLAALYAQNMDDAVIVEAVNEVEMLTTNLSQKMWQKITILSRLVHDRKLDETLAKGLRL